MLFAKISWQSSSMFFAKYFSLKSLGKRKKLGVWLLVELLLRHLHEGDFWVDFSYRILGGEKTILFTNMLLINCWFSTIIYSYIQHDIPSEKHYTYYRNCVFFWYADDNSCVSSLKSLGKFPLPPTWILTALPPFSLPLFYDLVWIKGRPPSYWLKIVGPSTFRLILEPNIWGSSRCTVLCL